MAAAIIGGVCAVVSATVAGRLGYAASKNQRKTAAAESAQAERGKRTTFAAVAAVAIVIIAM